VKISGRFLRSVRAQKPWKTAQKRLHRKHYDLLPEHTRQMDAPHNITTIFAIFSIFKWRKFCGPISLSNALGKWTINGDEMVKKGT